MSAQLEKELTETVKSAMVSGLLYFMENREKVMAEIASADARGVLWAESFAPMAADFVKYRFLADQYELRNEPQA